MSEFIIENGELKEYAGAGGDVVVPAGVTAIGENAFWNSGIKGVVLPNGLKRIKEQAFAGCRELKELMLPDSVNTIGKSAFSRCGIETLKLSAKLKQIPRDAFSSSALREIVLPEGVKSIGDNAFRHCTDLKKAVLPTSLEKIGYNAFADDFNLQEIVLPPNAQIAGGAFDFCNGLADNNGFIVINGGFFKSPALYRAHKVALPDGVKTVKSFSVDIRRDMDGVMWVTDREEIRRAREEKVGSIIEIPASVEIIESGAFLGDIKEIINHSAVNISGFAISRCNVKKITCK